MSTYSFTYVDSMLHIFHICQYMMTLGRRFATALLPRLFGTNPRSHHKGATGRVRTGDQRLPVLCHCQLGQDIPYRHYHHHLFWLLQGNIISQQEVLCMYSENVGRDPHCARGVKTVSSGNLSADGCDVLVAETKRRAVGAA